MPWTETEIATDRLMLRPLVDADKPAIVAMRTSEQVYRYLGGPTGSQFANELADATVGEQWGVFGIIDSMSGAAIGSVHLGRDRGVLEVSDELLPSAWGQGVAAEAVSALLAWAATESGDAEVIAVTQTANSRSVALLERLGFDLVRTFEEFDAEHGYFHRDRQRDPTTG
jgi:RimJ/RimL family protein N-acetyltransferase